MKIANEIGIYRFLYANLIGDQSYNLIFSFK